MQLNKWGVLGLAGALLISYNATQPGLLQLRNNDNHLKDPLTHKPTAKREGYAESLVWLDRLANSSSENGTDIDPKTQTIRGTGHVKLNFSVLSSLMVAGLASGFRSQVANLLWMKSDEYWHEGLFTRQVPLMEAVVTLDPQFIDAWSTAGWHWAYNIYADVPSNPDYKAKGDKAIRMAQDNAVETGIDYLDRGSAMNPDTYRLWFEYGWTRAEKRATTTTKHSNSTARRASKPTPAPLKSPGKLASPSKKTMDSTCWAAPSATCWSAFRASPRRSTTTRAT